MLTLWPVQLIHAGKQCCVEWKNTEKNIISKEQFGWDESEWSPVEVRHHNPPQDPKGGPVHKLTNVDWPSG